MKTVRRSVLLTLLSCGFASMPGVEAQTTFPTFRAVTIDAHAGNVVYAVTVADVNSDGRDDIVAVTEDRVLWYENPGWTSHVIIDNQTPRDNVCIAAHDIDGDGQVDFALGAGWTKIGTIHWIRRNADPAALWQVHAIGEELALHRMRWADVLHTGTPQLVISPLNASEDRAGARLMAFEIPADPATDRWPSHVLNEHFNRMHNHWHADVTGDGMAETLTASREGVHLVARQGDDWHTVRLGIGAVADDPNASGAGEIRFGHLADGSPLIATVEPMHGHSVAIYEQGAQGTGWTRQVVESGFQRGHALSLTDIDGQPGDEIIFGHSDTPDTFGIIVWQQTGGTPPRWIRHVIDAGGIATEDLVVSDLNDDGRPDIVGGGRATHNVMLYVSE